MVVFCEENGQQLLVPYSALMDRPGACYREEDAALRFRSRSFGDRSTASGFSKTKQKAIAAHSFDLNSGYFMHNCRFYCHLMYFNPIITFSLIIIVIA